MGTFGNVPESLGVPILAHGQWTRGRDDFREASLLEWLRMNIGSVVATQFGHRSPLPARDQIWVVLGKEFRRRDFDIDPRHPPGRFFRDMIQVEPCSTSGMWQGNISGQKCFQK